jgi:hypothetical protein
VPTFGKSRCSQNRIAYFGASMSVLAKVLQLVLRVLLHSFHLISLLVASWHRLFSTPPLPLQVTRRRIPRHLAVLLVLDSPHEPALIHESLLEIASRTVGWCRSVGIEKLTLYDSEGAWGPVARVSWDLTQPRCPYGLRGPNISACLCC